MHILITGASGLIGQRLTTLLQEKGHTVAHVSRRKKDLPSIKVYQWDIAKKELDKAALEGVDAIIHLAGAGIADKRWSAKRKKEIIDSRVQSTLLLKKALNDQKHQVKTFIGASAIGFYGDRGEEVLAESSQAGTGFLSETCVLWENSSESIGDMGIRRVLFRIGIVLAAAGGALPKTLLPLKLGMGSYFGNGKQYYSWIHIDDLCQMMIFALENTEVSGIYNGVAPNPHTNKDFVKTMAKVLGRPHLMMPVPNFSLRLLMGQMADILLQSANVSCQKIQESGFTFAFNDLEKALTKEIKK